MGCMNDGPVAHFDGSDDGGKFQQHAVAGRRLDDAAAQVGRDRLRSFAAFTYRARSIRLVLAHETRIADDVGGEDGGKATGGHPSGCGANVGGRAN
jgi:hypothetical protein